MTTPRPKDEPAETDKIVDEEVACPRPVRPIPTDDRTRRGHAAPSLGNEHADTDATAHYQSRRNEHADAIATACHQTATACHQFAGRRAERVAVGACLVGLAVLLSVQIGVGRWSGRELELERLPLRTVEYRVDVNTATEAELVHLPGIGPALARRILDDRAANGRYHDASDLDRVRGIGPKTVAKISPYLDFAAPEPGLVSRPTLP